ncbi:MAG: hypothetical protein GXO47_11880, partial [Chlorobi bacterium]|nr:hypothetical protein [Chlorobiota bacterium]
MKLLLYFILFLTTILSSCNLDKKSIKVVSFNIRYSNNSDSKFSWKNRKQYVTDFLKKENSDIISFQEVLKPQLDYLTDNLKEYSVISAGRDDGKDKGEQCPIFFNSSLFDLLAKSHFWLSETPDKPGSISWGAKLPRIVTWIKLQNRRTGHVFFVFNTHLSHVSEYARNKSVLLILDKIKSIADNVPVIVTGDFNATPDSEPYMLMTGNWHNYFSFSDSYKISTFPSIDDGLTFNGFKKKEGISRIDYIFVNGYLDVVKFRTFNKLNNPVFISDHYPIMAEMKFNIERLERNGKNKPLPRFAPKPVFETSVIVFEDSLIVPLRSDIFNSKIFYTTDGSIPDKTKGKLYTSPIPINKTTTITAITSADNFLSSAPEKRVF